MPSSSPTSLPLAIRKATLKDIPALTHLIDLSVWTLHTEHYTPAVIALALSQVYGVDTTLINDGHYFIITTPQTPSPSPSSPSSSPEMIIASGGWSNRRTLYGGDNFTSRDPTLLDPNSDAAKIRAMFVHPEYTRMGVGEVLIRTCEDAARDAGFKRVEMGATLSGMAFYERMGYTVLEGGEGERRVLRDGDGDGDGEVLELRRMGRAL